MSKLLETIEKLHETQAAIARLEEAAAGYPNLPSVATNLRSLQQSQRLVTGARPSKKRVAEGRAFRNPRRQWPALGSRRVAKGVPMLRIIESLIKGNTTEQLDETFEELMKAISLRSAQGMGTDEALSELLAALTAERNNRPPGG